MARGDRRSLRFSLPRVPPALDAGEPPSPPVPRLPAPEAGSAALLGGRGQPPASAASQTWAQKAVPAAGRALPRRRALLRWGLPAPRRGGSDVPGGGIEPVRGAPRRPWRLRAPRGGVSVAGPRPGRGERRFPRGSTRAPAPGTGAYGRPRRSRKPVSAQSPAPGGGSCQGQRWRAPRRRAGGRIRCLLSSLRLETRGGGRRSAPGPALCPWQGQRPPRPWRPGPPCHSSSTSAGRCWASRPRSR